jgi:hypothetical protein
LAGADFAGFDEGRIKMTRSARSTPGTMAWTKGGENMREVISEIIKIVRTCDKMFYLAIVNHDVHVCRTHHVDDQEESSNDPDRGLEENSA